MLNTIIATAKPLALPATLAYAGVRGSAMLGFTKAWQQVLAGIVLAGAGIFAASKIK